MRSMFFPRLCALVALLSPFAAYPASNSDPHEMLRSWLTGIATEQLAARRAQIEKIQTPGDVQKRSREVRGALLRMIGGLPQERTPLHVQRTGILDRGDYRIEKIIFESLPKVYVTANLYVPQTGKGPYPAVLQPTGHSVAAKARAFYQTLSLGLVKSGFVVLTYDPLGQGERRLFYDPDLEDSKVGGTTTEHNIVGIQSLLAGESVARDMIWDAMRSLDFLQSRTEVDPHRIGVAGCSGGGTITAYLAALDERVQAAASACYITDWEEQLKGTGPQDAEQQFPDLLRDGFDHGDLIIAAAPKPYLMCNTEQDFFPLEGARKTFQEVQRIYGVLGKEDRIAWAVGPGGHGMPKNIREAIYGWMNHWLKGVASKQANEPEFRTEFEEDLLCTTSGQVSTSLGGETESTLNRKRYAALPPAPPVLSARADLDRLWERLNKQVLNLTRYQSSTESLDVTESQPVDRGEYSAISLTYRVSGRHIPALLVIPAAGRSQHRTMIYLDPASHAEDPKPGSDLDQFARMGYTILAVDPSGTGKTTPRWDGYSDYWFGPDKTTWLALMVGRPLVGLRMDDIRRGIDLLDERHLLYGGNCRGFAKGLLAVNLLFAASADQRIGVLDLEGGLISYRSVAQTPIQRKIFEIVVPGILKDLDLPELAATLAPRPVRLRNLVSPLGKVEPLSRARRAYQFTDRAYDLSGATGKFDVGLRREDETVREAYPD